MRHPVGNTVANADKTAFVSKRNIQLLYNTANEEAPNICTHIWFILIQLYSHHRIVVPFGALYTTYTRLLNYACILYIWAYIIELKRLNDMRVIRDGT